MGDYEKLEQEIRAAARRSIWHRSMAQGGTATWTGLPQFGLAGLAINEALNRAGFAPEPLVPIEGTDSV